jgi:hypothetical protein
VAPLGAVSRMPCRGAVSKSASAFLLLLAATRFPVSLIAPAA